MSKTTSKASAASAPEPKPADPLTKVLRGLVGLAAVALVTAGSWYGYMYAVSPAAIQAPKTAHYHFRVQVINNGQPVNFADAKYQTDYDKDICTADLTREPFHFHDGLGQFAHVHWTGLTGGQFLKSYGWNLVGGPDDTLGFKTTRPLNPERVAIHGRVLPSVAPDANYYIYTGNASSYKERTWAEFLNTDLQTFFAGQTAHGPLDWIVPKAAAHGGNGDGHPEDSLPAASQPGASAVPGSAAAPSVPGQPGAATAARQAELAEINDLLGNVVIFVQKDIPSEASIKARFNSLIPLPESACAG